MNALAPTFDDPYGVRSLSLEELIARPPPLPLWRRFLGFTRIAVMAWGVISLGAIAGMAAYYLNSAPETALLLGEGQAPLFSEEPAPVPNAAPAKAEPARATAVDTAPPAEAVFAPAALPELSLLEKSTAATDARLPRPRPDEPVITGSLGPPRYDPDYAPVHRRRIANPCTTLRNLGAPIRCGNQARVYSPPPQPPPTLEYRPRPYQPPVFSN